MAYSNDELMGEASDPSDHPSTSMPTATQHYAGDVIPISAGPSGPGAGPTVDAVPYATGAKSDPQVKSIGIDTLAKWHTNRLLRSIK